MLGILLLIFAVAGSAQTPDPAYSPLEKAYEALRSKDYDRAIAAFQQAVTIAPDRPGMRKDLAYTYLKIGENEGARDQFAEAMRLDPRDDHVALEYAFLCYETKRRAEARRIFDRIRKNGNQTAAEAFENIDRPLREGLAQWTKAIKMSPDNFSAHEELARLAEQRDELPLAAEHYKKAWLLRPDRRALLLDLGRVYREVEKNDEADEALLAASRGAEPRVAEEARGLLPKRYPYVYEFQRALAVDPRNIELRRELAYLHVEMNNRADAEKEFRVLVEIAPNDLLSVAQLGLLHWTRGDEEGALPLLQRVLSSGDTELAERVRTAMKTPQYLQRRAEETRTGSSQAREIGLKSLEKGFLKDAEKYLLIAHESDPGDYGVMLKLGWTYNMLKDDREAVKWFNLASQSPDPDVAAEASRAYHNLQPSTELFRTTVWMFPTFSTRWHDLFGYAQAKTELRLRNFWLRPYISVRLVGDARGAVEFANWGAQSLSEQSLILGLGVATKTVHGVMGWFEAGESFRFNPTMADPGRALPDYRGGVSFTKGLGHLLAGGAHGLFAETNDDGIYVRRFNKDTLLYSQNRGGITMRESETLGGFHPQVYWSANLTADAQGQYWGSYVETGPGVKFKFEHWRVPLLFSVNLLRGAYLVNQDNPHRPNFNDLRIGVWYAFTH
ncbi:MAG TPA: tetratricopeptide repeat protein [Bryobacteraceae bacterium]|nr:tetratricopeptide repeat protein [Bryobacteraceae bacterium]